MSDQGVVGQVQEVPEVQPSPPPKQSPTVDQLVREAISALPQLTTCEDPLRVVMTVLATYVGGPDIPVLKVDREIALLELELTQSWSAKSVKEACDAVMEGLTRAVADLQEMFERETGTQVKGADFQAFAKRYTDEREEQAKYVKWAMQLLESVKVISGQLGIPNPDPGAQPQVAEEKPSLVDKLGNAALATGKKVKGVFVVQRPEGKEEPLLSWQTPPVLDESDRDLKLLGLVQNRLSAEADVQLVWVILERLKLGREVLTDLLAKVATKARKQLDQSKRILAQVGTDNGRFNAMVAAVQSVQHIVLSVHDFVFPERAKT